MKKPSFNRDAWARKYAKSHIRIDPGVVTIHYLPTNAPPREIRLLEINDEIVEWGLNPLEPLDFGVDPLDSPTRHTLTVLDVTPSQWDKIEKGKLKLPPGWSLEGKVSFPGKKTEKAT